MLQLDKSFVCSIVVQYEDFLLHLRVLAELGIPYV